MTHPDSDCNSPKFFVTQKVNRRPGSPPSPTLSSPPPASQMGLRAGGKGVGEKRADCAKENKRDRETSRDRKRGETYLVGERRRGGDVVASASARAWEGSREGRA